MNVVTDYICGLLPARYSEYICSLPNAKLARIKEIRLRIGKPLAVKKDIRKLASDCIFAEMLEHTSRDEIELVMARLSDHSMNSVKDTLKQGFIPLKYGCRAGVAGEILFKNGAVDFQRSINSINIRIAHEYKGCSDNIFNEIYDGNNILNTVIISAPMMGKTTLLRDIARRLGDVLNVCIIDERSEIASCCNGIAQFDVGKGTDILDCCPKPEGIAMAIRSMSPNVIITDEIGSEVDCNALADAASCGVSFVATLHADSLASAKRRKSLHTLFDTGAVQKAIILGNSHGIGTVESIETL